MMKLNWLYIIIFLSRISKNENVSLSHTLSPDIMKLKMQNDVNNNTEFLAAAADFYSNEKYLRALKRLNPNADSKSIVDRATKKPLHEVLAALDALDEFNLEDVQNFVDLFLHPPGVEIKAAKLTDWSDQPDILHRLQNKELKEFFGALNRQWLDLYKAFDAEMLGPGSVSSHLPMLHPFIVPGGRFLEIYYWDTYWTVEGLLVSGMFDTVRQMIENFVNFINLYGFIPNGSRVYYLNRSQPPYFAQIVLKYYETCLNSDKLTLHQKSLVKEFVFNEALDSLKKEYDFWMKEKLIEINFKNKTYKVNIFKAKTDKPRPESYFEDIITADFLTDDAQKGKLYQHIASGAESGHDFTSRWFQDPMKISTIEASDIIPVDLNAILYKTELVISKLSHLKGDLDTAKQFRNFSIERMNTINTVLWSQENKMWNDLNINRLTAQSEHFYLSNLSPLWFGIEPPQNVSETEMIDLHIRNSIDNYNGVPFSYIYSKEQWDFPNAWAPYQLSVVEMIYKFDEELALRMARKFFNSVYTGWKVNDAFYEKYNSLCPGQRGAGGEYEVQSGFGWTNGVVLRLIEVFGDKLMQN
ncbi:Neutral trehalase [Brachionus plicatilis]|uniref:Trehalase n=1 Tax=Brachionus plicatilis TaxID=10195 RepID=A0A3M7QZP7_BRAPC|nr:Neutral trehalase [Brachionus plicatilis]